MFLVAGFETAAGNKPGIWGQAGCFWPEETYDGYHIGECAYQGYSAFGERQGHHDATIGVIAHEIEDVLPELVVERDNGYIAVRYEKIVALLIECIKEQQGQIDK